MVLVRHETEGDGVDRTVFNTLDAEKTFTLPQLRVRIAGALAVFQAGITIDTYFWIDV